MARSLSKLAATTPPINQNALAKLYEKIKTILRSNKSRNNNQIIVYGTIF